MPEANDARRGNDPTRTLQRKLYRAAKQSSTRRFHALYDKVHRMDVLWRAWREVARNRGSPGVDGVSIAAIRAAGEESFLLELRSELREQRYTPLPVKRVAIPKRSGGERPLGIPALRDRVVQAAAKIVLEPIFEAGFADCSYGFRPLRSALQARERVRSGMRQGRRWVVDADIRGFYDHLSHAQLLAAMRARVCDQRVLKLVVSWLQSDVLVGEELLHPMAGTPQGGVISPLLANVYLDRLDQAWDHARDGELTRYADDLVVMCRTKRQAEAALERLRTHLRKMGLELSESKTRIVDCGSGAEGFDFLGYHFRYRPTKRNRHRYYAATWPSRGSMAAARDRIRQLTPVARVGLPAITVVQGLNVFLRGWGAYFRYGNSTQQFKHVDRYVVERLSRLIARKHGSRNWRRGMVDIIDSRTRLGIYQLAGTVVYPSAQASR